MVNFDELPTELKDIIASYLNQQTKIDEMQRTIEFLENKIAQLRRANNRLTLHNIQQLSDIHNLEYILANDAPVARRIQFEEIELSDSDSEYDSDVTIMEV